MEVHFLGVRGSTPAPGPSTVRYGGNTSCVALAHDGSPPTLVLDAGTGIRSVGGLLGEAPFAGTVLLTHLHWDHTHGLPFARALDRDDATVDLWLPAQPGAVGDPADALARSMGPPNFPITPHQLRGRWRFSALEPGEHRFEGFTVTAAEIPHKGGRTFGYRVTDGTGMFAYLPDHSPVAVGPGPDGLGERHRVAVDLLEGVDVLAHDSQHTVTEFARVAGFGHSTIDYAVDLGAQAGVTTVVLFHHDPDRTDDALDAIVAGYADRSSGPEVIAAREGLVLRV